MCMWRRMRSEDGGGIGVYTCACGGGGGVRMEGE